MSLEPRFERENMTF